MSFYENSTSEVGGNCSYSDEDCGVQSVLFRDYIWLLYIPLGVSTLAAAANLFHVSASLLPLFIEIIERN